MRSRVVPLVCVLVLLTAACGSRLSDEELATGGGGGGTGSGGGSSGGAAAPGEGGGGEGAVGTLEAPCGPAGSGGGEAAAAPAPAPAPAGPVPGVTADTIRIGVVSDKAGPVPVPTIGIEESVQAFVAYCNEQGGINGRQLELMAYDSGVFNNAEVTQQACNDDLFALVGTGSVQDQQGAQIRVDCGLPEVAAYSATAERGLSDDFFSPVSSAQDGFNVGPCRYIAEQFPDAVTKAGVVFIDIDASKFRAQSLVEACEREAGFDFVYQKGVPPLNTNWGPVVSEMKDQGVKHFTMVSTTDDTNGLLRAASDQGLEFDVIDLGQQYYDPVMLQEPGAADAYVLTNTAPFFETESNPALQVYEEYLEEVAPDVDPTTLGVQAFSAGLLFAEAASSLGDDLTREGLLTALEGIHEWDAGGLQMPSDPGSREQPGCFLYLQIEDSEFVRKHPEEGFDCDPSYVVPLQGNYGEGATRAGS